MMHRCSSQGHNNNNNNNNNMLGPCSCGLFRTQPNSSMFLSTQNHHYSYNYNNSSNNSNVRSSSSSSFEDDSDYYYNTNNMYSLSPPSVDCTLSLGTPSTRGTGGGGGGRHERRPSGGDGGSCVPNFCWDILQSKTTTKTTNINASSHKSSSSVVRTSNNSDDPLLARRCSNCDTTSTPLWRNGPRGPKSLCNACGIRFKKEERRANANGNKVPTMTTTQAAAATTTTAADYNYYANSHNQSNVSWVQAQKVPCYATNEFRFIEDRGDGFLSWRLNVADRPSLVHDFTR